MSSILTCAWRSLMTQNRRGRRRASCSERVRLHLEPLEARLHPAVLSALPTARDGNDGSLRTAAYTANLNGQDNVIVLAPGTYPLVFLDPTTIRSEIRLTAAGHTIVFEGAGAGTTVIDASPSGDRAFHVFPGVTAVFENLTITGGSAVDDGTGHRSDTSIRGGGILNDGGSITLRNVDLLLDRAQGTDTSPAQGGAIYNSGTANLIDVSLLADQALGSRGSSAQGGAIYNSGTLMLQGVTLANDQAIGGGGANGEAGSSIIGSPIDGTNGTDGGSAQGGGIFNAGTALIRGSTLVGNSAQGGPGGAGGAGAAQGISWAGWYQFGADGAGGNGGAAQGGGICNSGALTLIDSSCTGNHVVAGAAGSSPTSGKSGQVGAANPGAGLANTDGSAALDHCVFSSNLTDGVASDYAGYGVAVNDSLFAAPPALAQVAPSHTTLAAVVGTAYGEALQVRVRDVYGNVAAGVGVTFRVKPSTLGARGVFAGGLLAVRVVADADGFATAPLMIANAVAGSYTVTAQADGAAGPVVFTLTNVGRTARVRVDRGDGAKATVNALFLGPVLSARVTDSRGAPVRGLTVAFDAPDNGPSGIFDFGSLLAVTDADGIAYAPPLVANTVAGTFTVTASVEGIATPARFMLTNVVDKPASMTASAGDAQTTTVATDYAKVLQVLVTDQYGNPEPGIPLTFALPTSGPTGTFAKRAVVPTDAQGLATASRLTAGTTAGTFTVLASADGLPDVAFTLTNVPGAVSTWRITNGAKQSAAVGSTFATPMLVKVQDAYGNPISNATVNFTLPPDTTGPNGTFASSGSVQTDSGGVATAPKLTANRHAGVFTVFAGVVGKRGQVAFHLTITAENT
jgi:hypothetical protein